MRQARRYWWIAAGVAMLALAVVAFGSLQAAKTTSQSTAYDCAPKPCANPSGFGIYLSEARVEAGRLRMKASFINHPHQQALVDYNHTSPADFQLRYPDGTQVKPVFSADCPEWPELRVKIGAAAGPVPVCFPAPTAGLRGSLLIWGPDLGFAFDDVQVPLQPVAPASSG